MLKGNTTPSLKTISQTLTKYSFLLSMYTLISVVSVNIKRAREKTLCWNITLTSETMTSTQAIAKVENKIYSLNPSRRSTSKMTSRKTFAIKISVATKFWDRHTSTRWLPTPLQTLSRSCTKLSECKTLMSTHFTSMTSLIGSTSTDMRKYPQIMIITLMIGLFTKTFSTT